MKKPSVMIALALCLFLVTSTVSAVSLVPTNVIEMTIFTETKTTVEMPDMIGGVIGIPNTDESEALVVCSIQPDRRVCSIRGMNGMSHNGVRKWSDHPAFIGIE